MSELNESEKAVLRYLPAWTITVTRKTFDQLLDLKERGFVSFKSRGIGRGSDAVLTELGERALSCDAGER